MIEKALIKLSVKSANGNFSRFMSQGDRKDVVRMLQYAAKKANEVQKKLVKSAEK